MFVKIRRILLETILPKISILFGEKNISIERIEGIDPKKIAYGMIFLNFGTNMKNWAMKIFVRACILI